MKIKLSEIEILTIKELKAERVSLRKISETFKISVYMIKKIWKDYTISRTGEILKINVKN